LRGAVEETVFPESGEMTGGAFLVDQADHGPLCGSAGDRTDRSVCPRADLCAVGVMTMPVV
jgi:hypothetical protein